MKIAFIGAGNMARAIIGGLVADGVDPTSITAAGPRQASLDVAATAFGVATQCDNGLAAKSADILVLGVKPQMLKEVCLGLRDHLSHKPLIISLAAGITTTSLAHWLGDDQAIVRAMPNTPSQIGVGAAGVFANAQVDAEQRDRADRILRAVGIVQWLDDETLIDAVTAVSGSGPAYYFLFMEAMIAAGVAQGLSPDVAKALTVQTALGAAQLAQQSDVGVDELRRRVTSPKGTTEQAILRFEEQQLRAIVSEAMDACAARARELSVLLGS